MAAILSQWWDKPQWEWTETCFRLLVDCLQAAASPDAEFARIIRRVNPKAMKWRQAKAEFHEAILPRLEEAAAKGRFNFMAWLQVTNDQIMSDDLLEEEDRCRLVHLLDIFSSVRMQMLAILERDPERISSVVKYVTSIWAEESSGARLTLPRVYCHYPDNWAYAKLGRPTYSTDDFFHLKTHSAAPHGVLRRLARQAGRASAAGKPVGGEDRPVTEVFLHPVPNVFAREGELMPAPWGAFARDFAGCVALSEGISPTDPVLRHWARVTARKHGLKFVRRN